MTIRMQPADGTEPPREVDINDVASELLTSDLTWFEVRNPTEENLSTAMDLMNLHSVVRDACLDPDPFPQSLFLDETAYVAFPMAFVDANNELVRTTVIVLIRPRVVVTILRQDVNPWTNWAAWIRKRPTDLSRRERSLLFAHLLLDYLGDQSQRYPVLLRESVDRLAENVDHRPEQVEPARILELKRDVSRILSTFEDQQFVLSAIVKRVDEPLLEENLLIESVSVSDIRAFYIDLLNVVKHSMRLLSRLETRLQHIHQHYLLYLQDKTNHRMTILTVFSAIFLPLSLIAGIYGMNFQYMPELSEKDAYFTTLGVMACLSVGQLIYFWRRGWFE